MARAVFGMAAAAATSIVLLGQLGRTHHTFDQYNSMLSLLLPVLAIALAGALRTKDRATIAVATVGLAIGGFQLGGATLAGVGRDARGAQDSGSLIKVVTFSTYHANPTPEAIPPLLQAQLADVIVLQETDGTPGPVVNAMMPDYNRIRSCSRPECSLTILSRWPLRRIAPEFASPGPHPDVLMGDIDAPFGTLRVIGVHLPRPYDKAYGAAIRQLGDLARANGAVPLIVAGDFNTATGSFDLARFAQGSGLRRQDRFVPTYPANAIIPAFAVIDHIFADGRWSRAGCRRMGAAHSDHYGVACHLRLRESS